MRQIDESQKRVISNTQASKPEVPSQTKTLPYIPIHLAIIQLSNDTHNSKKKSYNR